MTLRGRVALWVKEHHKSLPNWSFFPGQNRQLSQGTYLFLTLKLVTFGDKWWNQ